MNQFNSTVKLKTKRICARKGCNKEFKLYKTTDKYCSRSCMIQDQKKQERKPEKQYKLKPESEKRKRESYQYTKKRKTFMSKAENEFCPVCKAAFEGLIDVNEIPYGYLINRNGGQIRTSEVHHKAGRKGKLLLYVPYWLAVSSIGHKWIHANPEKAYKLKFLIRSTTVNI